MRHFVVNAFADHIWAGNPAAVCPLAQWPKDGLLQAMASQHNLSETAFFVPSPTPTSPSLFELRWFTPTHEVDLCGHATLASAHVLFEHLGHPTESEVFFSTRSGQLSVRCLGDRLAMRLPSKSVERMNSWPEHLMGMGNMPTEVWAGDDYLLVYEDEQSIRALQPDWSMLAKLDRRGVIATAKSDGNPHHFVSRFFVPKLGVNEDPVTGSAHCALFPFWSSRLGVETMSAFQCSARGGALSGRLVDQGVELQGSALTYSIAQFPWKLEDWA